MTANKERHANIRTPFVQRECKHTEAFVLQPFFRFLEVLKPISKRILNVVAFFLLLTMIPFYGALKEAFITQVICNLQVS